MKLKDIFRGLGRKKKKEQAVAPPQAEKTDPNAWPEAGLAGVDADEEWPEPDVGSGTEPAETWPDGGGAAETWPDTEQGAPEPWTGGAADSDADTATAWPDANAGGDAGEAAAWPEETPAGDAGGESAWPSGGDPDADAGAAWPSEGGATEPPAEEEDGKKGKKKPKKGKKPKKKKKKKGEDAAEGEEGGKKKKPKLLLILIPAVVLIAATAAVLLILKPWAPKEPKAEEPEIVEEEPKEEEPAAEATAADLTPARPAPPPVKDTAGAMDHFAALDPGSLGLEGESMAEYRYYATGKTITVDGIRCREIMVYSVSESAGTNDMEGRYFLSMDTEKLFRDNGADGVEELSPSVIGIGE